MKKILAFLLATLLLSACAESGFLRKESVQFYYPQKSIPYNGAGVIGAENREAQGHTEDLRFLLALYLMGPVDEKFTNAFPERTQLLEVTQEGSNISIILSDTAKTISDIRFSLACTCLLKTCMELADVDSLTVTSGSRSIRLSAADYLLVDNSQINSSKGEIT